MGTQNTISIEHFCLVGINYKKSDTLLRGRFAVSSYQYELILQQANEVGLQNVFVLSTCNRTEIYGIAQHPQDLMKVLCSQTLGTLNELEQAAYTKNGYRAVKHLFLVTAGLDSQILGDYEILGQMKTATQFAKQRGFIGSLLERIINTALQASKEIKTNTALSSGTISVSFTAIQYLKSIVPKQDRASKNILLIGTGKMGTNTCKNIVDYLHTNNVTVINRTHTKAEKLAQELNLKTAPYSKLKEQAAIADIIIVSTHASKPILHQADFINSKSKIIIDLSIPNNVAPNVAALPNMVLINVDDLSKIKDKTLSQRLAEVPKAKEIIASKISELEAWQKMRSHVPILKAVKKTLMDMHQSKLFLYKTIPNKKECNPQKIQKVINTMASKLREQNTKGCHYIEALNEYITASTHA